MNVEWVECYKLIAHVQPDLLNLICLYYVIDVACTYRHVSTLQHVVRQTSLYVLWLTCVNGAMRYV